MYRTAFDYLTTAAATFVIVAAMGGLAAAERPDVAQLLADAGIEGGILVQLGCDDAQLTLDLYGDGRFVVQALDRDPQKVAAARGVIQSRGCYGPVSARRLHTDRLPFVDNLVNLLVVADPLGISEAEMLRVVRPLGRVVVRQGNQWRTVDKAWPSDIDEWTHFLHGPTGNAVSQDAQVGPPRRLQWSAGPMWGRSHETNNSFAALVTGQGRMFYVFDKGVTGMEDPRLGQQWWLIARDAFNGALLWERPLSTWGRHVWQSQTLRFFGGDVARRLVVDGDKLYVTLEFGGGVNILDAATGKTVGEIPATKGAKEILVDGDHVFVASIQQEERRGGAARLTCFDTSNGTMLWRSRDQAVMSQVLSVSPGEVVYHNRKEVVCLNRNDGSPRWKVTDPPSGKRGGKMLLLADGKVVVSSRKEVVALAASTGKVAWQAPGPQGGSMRDTDLFFARGAVWCSGANDSVVGYDINSGEQVGQIHAGSVQSRGHHLRCYRAKATEDFLITQFRGVEFLSLDDQRHTQQDWLRGTCTYGVMPANGFLYVPPHSCLCFSAATFHGLTALAAESPRAAAGSPEKYAAGPLEKGPAYGSDLPAAATADKSWPTYRHDARRTGASANGLPGSLKRSWQVAFETDLTPPVAAAGRVYVAAKHYVNEDIFNVGWRGERMSTYDKLAGILVDENESVGERDLGLHLFTTSGFLDASFFNRTYWMYSKTWTGFNHANLAPKSGQLLVIGPQHTYALKAYTSRYPLSPKLDPQTKGYLLIADDNDNEPTLDPRAWGKDKGMGFSRGAEPKWHDWLPVRVQAMVLAGSTLVVCGPPDVVPEDDPLAAFEGRLGSELRTISATDGKTIARQKLTETPLFDGMIVADDRLYLCTEQRQIICMKGE